MELGSSWIVVARVAAHCFFKKGILWCGSLENGLITQELRVDVTGNFGDPAAGSFFVVVRAMLPLVHTGTYTRVRSEEAMTPSVVDGTYRSENTVPTVRLPFVPNDVQTRFHVLSNTYIFGFLPSNAK